MTPTEQDKHLRALLGEMPNFVIDWLELSDDLRNEWKKGGKASDFGGHRTFIQKYEEKLAKLITADRKRVALEARIGALDTIHKRLAASDLNTKHYKIISKMLIESKEGYREAMKQEPVAQIKAQQEEV